MAVFLIAILIAAVMLTLSWASKSYGAYSLQGVTVEEGESIEIPKEHFIDPLLAISKIDLWRCPRFAYLRWLPGDKVTLTREDLMLIYLYVSGDEQWEHLKQKRAVSITYDWETTVFSIGYSNFNKNLAYEMRLPYYETQSDFWFIVRPPYNDCHKCSSPGRVSLTVPI